jgi:glycosyltransferase involved in cell wall biosynthesis
MEIFVSSLLAICSGLLSVPVAIFFVEMVAASILPDRDCMPCKGTAPRGKIAVLVPAHNESKGLLPTISDIQKQLFPNDRLLVVADNCTDDTASVASAADAEVAERYDPANRGKGYALEFGVKHLVSDPPDILVVIDADCRLAEGTIERLAKTCAMTRRPVQALYLMTAPDESKMINHKVAEFSWRVKNWARPLGLRALCLPCQLVGTGMAFPWNVIRLADLANGWLVEDLKLGLDLAAAGHPPIFLPSACVTSQFASSIEGAKIQRERWEQGHINTILTLVPRLLFGAIARWNWRLLALSLDAAVPPLSLLGILVAGMFMIAGSATALFGLSPIALAISAISALAFLLAAFLAWLKYGREVLPPSALLLIVPYALAKLGVYFRVLSNKMDARWIRTDRNNS